MTSSARPAASLWWPGDHRAGDLMADVALLRAMARVEDAWLGVLAGRGVVPDDGPPLPAGTVADLVGETDLPDLAVAAESGGNPVMPLVALLRERLLDAGHASAATWLHRGLTSQDVVDTAIVLCAREAVDAVRAEQAEQVRLLCALAVTHRGSPMVARTLTQAAVPTTFGAKAAGWLHGVLDAADDLGDLTFPVQLGGAAGTLSGLVEIVGVARARACRTELPDVLGLAPAPPWHTDRATVTRLGDAAVRAGDVWGRIANDVLTLGRPEIGELAEGLGGGSSTMPHKANPTLSVLVRRHALAAPPLAATLHAAAAAQVDERADGGWHVEWATLATLLRRTVVAAAQTTSLLAGLRVDVDRMRARLHEVADDVHAEQRSLAALAGHPVDAVDPSAPYLGLVDDLVDEAVARADAHPLIRPSQETP